MDSKKTIVLILVLIALLVVNTIIAAVGTIATTILLIIISSSNTFPGYAGIIITAIALVVIGVLIGVINLFVIKRITQNDQLLLFGTFFTSLGSAYFVSQSLLLMKTLSMMGSRIGLGMPSDSTIMSNSPIAATHITQVLDSQTGMLLFTLFLFVPVLFFYFKKKERDNKALVWFIIALLVFVVGIPWWIQESINNMIRI